MKETDRSERGEYQTHSPNHNRSGLIRKTSEIGEKNTPKPRKAFQHYKGENESVEREDLYPLIELPNPQAGEGDHEPIVRVYRP